MMRFSPVTTIVVATGLASMTSACPYANLGGENPHILQQQQQQEHQDEALRSPKPRSTASSKVNKTTRRLGSSPSFFVGSVAEAVVAAQHEIRDLILERERLGPLFLRMGFHDCIGGCDGCIDMANPDNAGLDDPIEAIQDTVDFFAYHLSRADVWALATLTAAEEMQAGAEPFEMPSYSFDYYGRVDGCTDPMAGDAVPMPSSRLDTQGLLDFFEEQFGFTPQQVVAIMGAHSVGLLSNQNSGYSGTWTPRPTSLDFEFFKLLLLDHNDNNNNNHDITGNASNTDAGGEEQESRAQSYMLSSQGNDNGKALWVFVGPPPPPPFDDGPPSPSDGLFVPRGEPPPPPPMLMGGTDPQRRLVMLHSDMALVNDYVVLDGKNTSCHVGVDCPHASTVEHVIEYSNDNHLFLRDFQGALTAMTLNGYHDEISSWCTDPPCYLGANFPNFLSLQVCE